MEIKLKIPDRYKNRNFFIFAGNDPVARKFHDKDYWEVKVSECSFCGKCCRTLRGESFPFRVHNGVCEYLDCRPGRIEQYCGLGAKRPFWCAIGANENSECSVRFKEGK